MPSRIPRDTAIVALLLGVFICRAVVGMAVVPPWQGPDEPTHFILAQMVAVSGVQRDPLVNLPEGHGIVSARERALQEQVLISMAHHRWWEAYGGRAPEPLPTTLRQVPRLGVGMSMQPLYYGIGASVLRITRPDDLEAASFHLRALSVLLCLCALWLGWAGTRLLFGSAVAAGATTVAVLHPQFLLTSLSVNPDALVIVIGSSMWWLTACVVTNVRRTFSFALLVLAAVAAVLTKRSALAFAAVAVLASAVSFLRLEGNIRRGKVIPALLLGAAAAIGAGWMVFAGPLADLGTFWTVGLDVKRSLDHELVSAAFGYLQLSIDYAWLIVGWLRFPAPEPWLWVVRVLTVAGFSAAAVLLIRSREMRYPLSIAWLIVVAQAATVVGWGFLTLASPQGRYLFPAIAPATALLWLGLTHATPSRIRPYAAPALVVILALLDVTAFTAVLIPAYLPWG